MHPLANLPAFRTGTWLYANETPLRVQIVGSPVRLGTGDYEDPAELAEDHPESTYYVLYQVAGSDDTWAGGPSAPSLDEAARLAELALGPTLKWNAP